jgi:hypothetical protein
VQQVIEIPPDSGEGLVEGADVDADAQLPLTSRGGTEDAHSALSDGMGQSVNDGAGRGP